MLQGDSLKPISDSPMCSKKAQPTGLCDPGPLLHASSHMASPPTLGPPWRSSLTTPLCLLCAGLPPNLTHCLSPGQAQCLIGGSAVRTDDKTEQPVAESELRGMEAAGGGSLRVTACRLLPAGEPGPLCPQSSAVVLGIMGFTHHLPGAQPRGSIDFVNNCLYLFLK